MEGNKVGIVLPTYNEIANLSLLLAALRINLPKAWIFIVDDNSLDGTGQLADHEAIKDPLIKVIHRSGKLGLGTAYINGFKEALLEECTIIVQMDADFSHDPSAVPLLIKELVDVDLVLGSRYVLGAKTINWNLFRSLISQCGSIYARTLLKLPYRDITGGFKAWKASALENILKNEIYSNGYSFQIETTCYAHRAGMLIKEIPISFTNRHEGESKMDFSIILEALCLCWKLHKF